MRIRSRLLMLVLAVLIPAFLTAGLGIAYVYHTAQEDHRNTMREISRAMALVLDKELGRRLAVLDTLGQSKALDGGDLGSFYAQAQRVAPTPDTAILLHNTDGHILFDTRSPGFENIAPDLEVMQQLRQQYGSEATFVSNLYFSPSGQAYSFSLQTPVKRNGRVIYYLQMSVFADHLQALFDEQRLPAQWFASVVDRNGVVVARNHNPSRYVGKEIVGPLFDQIIRDPDGFHEGTILEKEPLSSYFSRTSQWGWSFLVSLPQYQLREAALQAISMMSALSLILLSVALGVAFLLGRSIAEKIEALRRAAQMLGAGLPVRKTRSGLLEVDAVHATLVQASEDIRSNQQELNRRVEEAVALVESSQKALLRGQKLEALGRLTGGIAHDFNNVLQTLTTGLQVVAHSTPEVKAQSALDACQRAVDRSSELVQQLMAFGRVQESHLEIVQIDQQLDAITVMLHSALSSNIALEVDVADALWPVSIDPLQFELALLNLTINARDAMPTGGTVCIKVINLVLELAQEDLQPGEYVCLTLSDTGSGMSEETLAHAFDPFFTTKNIGEGSGLGLPQAYGFARQSGGLLTLESQPGAGTVARFYLPRASNKQMTEGKRKEDHDALPPYVVVADAAQGAATDDATLFEEMSLAGKTNPETTPAIETGSAAQVPDVAVQADTILLVEDDVLVRDVVTPALTAAGFVIQIATTGEEAIRLLESGATFDLVFSDIVMPGMVSGIDLARWVQQHRPGLQVVLATGYSEQHLSLPGVPVLSKPYDIDVVMQILQTSLMRSQK